MEIALMESMKQKTQNLIEEEKSMEHTPGPWEIDGYDVFNAKSGDLIATVWAELDNTFQKAAPTEEAEANRTLIATSPLLLEALEGLYKVLLDIYPSSKMKQAKQAIDKAKGK